MPHPSTQPLKVCTCSLNWLVCVYHQKPYINTALCHLGPNQRCSVAKSDAYHIIFVHTRDRIGWKVLRSRWLCITSRPAFFYQGDVVYWLFMHINNYDCSWQKFSQITIAQVSYDKSKEQLYKETLCPRCLDKASCYLSMTWLYCMRQPSPSLGHPSTSDEDWYWPKCVLILQSATLQNI